MLVMYISNDVSNVLSAMLFGCCLLVKVTAGLYFAAIIIIHRHAEFDVRGENTGCRRFGGGIGVRSTVLLCDVV
jgi:hypothetical protein